MNKTILKLIRPSWIPCKFQQQKAKSISSTLHAHKKMAKTLKCYFYSLKYSVMYPLQIFSLLNISQASFKWFFRHTPCHLRPAQVTELYRKGEVRSPYMKDVFSNLETYSDFTYILNSDSTRRGIGTAIVLKAKIANKTLCSHSGEF